LDAKQPLRGSLLQAILQRVDDINYPGALVDLQDVADPKVEAALAAYVGSLRATLAHAISQ